MRGHKAEELLFVTCWRSECRQQFRVTNYYRQRTRKYCSRRCATLAAAPIMKLVRQKGGLVYGAKRRAALLERVKDLTPLEAFRTGYLRGLQSKHRQLRKASAA